MSSVPPGARLQNSKAPCCLEESPTAITGMRASGNTNSCQIVHTSRTVNDAPRHHVAWHGSSVLSQPTLVPNANDGEKQLKQEMCSMHDVRVI